jgi:alpha-galactosidase
VQVFRRSAVQPKLVRVQLRGLDANAKYQITSLTHKIGSGRLEMSGAELQQAGLPVTIEERPGAAVIKYKRVR